jgi:hypothetical protein
MTPVLHSQVEPVKHFEHIPIRDTPILLNTFLSARRCHSWTQIPQNASTSKGFKDSCGVQIHSSHQSVDYGTSQHKQNVHPGGNTTALGFKVHEIATGLRSIDTNCDLVLLPLLQDC